MKNMKHIKHVEKIYCNDTEITFKEFCYNLAEFFIHSIGLYKYVRDSITTKSTNEYDSDCFLRQRMYKMSELLKYYNMEYKSSVSNQQRISTVESLTIDEYTCLLISYMSKYKKSKLIAYFARYYGQNFVNVLFEYDCQKLTVCEDYMMFKLNNDIYTVIFDVSKFQEAQVINKVFQKTIQI